MTGLGSGCMVARVIEGGDQLCMQYCKGTVVRMAVVIGLDGCKGECR